MQDSDEKENNFSVQFKKYLPSAVLTLLTLSLMIFFKYNRQGITSMIEHGKGSVIDFYTQNLKPLLFQTDITNEDVFNFALYQNIPVDKKGNRVLQINEYSDDYELLTIQPTIFNESTDNYEKFIGLLDVNEKERAEIDALLESYQDELYSSILVNENNAIAVNPRVLKLQKAILIDLALFAQKYHKGELSELPFPGLTLNRGFDNPDMIDITWKTTDDDFIFFTPDTIFTQECRFDKTKLKQELESARKDIMFAKSKLTDIKIIVDMEHPKLAAQFDSLIEMNIHFQIDSMRSIVALPKFNEEMAEKFSTIKIDLKNLSDILKTFSAGSGKDLHVSKKIDGDSEYNFSERFEINIQLDSIINSSLKLIENMDLSEMENLEYNLDSLIQFNKIDSINKNKLQIDKYKRKR